MNLMRKAVSALGGIFLAALLIAALAPKATRGIAAALVQVVNNVGVVNPVDGNGNPIPVVTTDVDAPVHSPFDVENVCFFGFFEGVEYQCYINPLLSVPAGQVAKVEYVSVHCFTGGTSPNLIDLVNGTAVDHIITVPGGVLQEPIGQSVSFYISGTASTDPFAVGHLNALIRSADSSTTGDCFVTVSGYMAPQ